MKTLNFKLRGSQNTKPVVSVSTSGIQLGAVASITATASDADGSVSKVDFYIDNKLVHTEKTAPYTYSFTPSGIGSFSVKAVATDNSGQATTSSSVTLTVAAKSSGTVHDIPGMVPVEGFSSKSGNLSIQKLQSVPNTYNIGYIRNKDYIEYDINVKEAGLYNLEASLSSAGIGGRILIYVNGNLLGNMLVPVNGNWDTYYDKTEELKTILSIGRKKLRLVFEGEDNSSLFNIRKLNFKKQTSSSKLSNSKEDIAQSFGNKVNVYPNPVIDFVTIINDASFIGQKIDIYDLKGSLILTTENKAQTTINLSNLEAGMYLMNVRSKEENNMFKIVKK